MSSLAQDLPPQAKSRPARGRLASEQWPFRTARARQPHARECLGVRHPPWCSLARCRFHPPWAGVCAGFRPGTFMKDRQAPATSCTSIVPPCASTMPRRRRARSRLVSRTRRCAGPAPRHPIADQRRSSGRMPAHSSWTLSATASSGAGRAMTVTVPPSCVPDGVDDQVWQRARELRRSTAATACGSAPPASRRPRVHEAAS